MIKFLPIFPLNPVVYPGQKLNLHIYEERYKQLINECKVEGKTFGIPSVVKDQLNEFGTEMKLLEISKVYDDGKMDVKTEGVNMFRIMEVIKQVPDKLYSGAVVSEINYLPLDTNMLNPTLMDLIKQLHQLLDIQFDVFKKFENPLSFDLAPYVGLSVEDQYRILTSPSEKGRQFFLVQHLQKVIPTIKEAEKVKEKISLNGHFRHEISPDF